MTSVSVKLNHLIVWARDQQATARFVAEILGLGAPIQQAPFTVVRLTNEVTLDFLSTSDEISPQHYAFLATEQDFDDIYARIAGQGLQFWAGPGHYQPGRINTRDGGRGVYFDDPNGHSLEVITRPYGSGSSG